MKTITIFDENFGTDRGTSPYIITDIWKEWLQRDKQSDIHIYTDKLCFSSDLNTEKINCAWIVEPPIINGENYLYIARDYKKFKYVFSYIRQLENKIDNFVYVPFGTTYLKQEDINIYPKTKLISSIFSDKQWNSYHRFRHQIYSEYKNSTIDFYGSGTGNYIEYKLPSLKDYMFSVVVENSEEEDYFTEKLLDCFLTGTIPIYKGCPSIGNYFDIDGIFSFKDIDDLNTILKSINETTYNSLLKSIHSNYIKAKQYIHPELFLNNKLCTIM